MRILLVSDAHRIGGAEYYMYLLASGLMNVGHEVHLICPRREEWLDFVQNFKETGAQVHQLPLKSRNDLGRYYFFLITCFMVIM